MNEETNKQTNKSDQRWCRIQLSRRDLNTQPSKLTLIQLPPTTPLRVRQVELALMARWLRMRSKGHGFKPQHHQTTLIGSFSKLSCILRQANALCHFAQFFLYCVLGIKSIIIPKLWTDLSPAVIRIIITCVKELNKRSDCKAGHNLQVFL